MTMFAVLIGLGDDPLHHRNVSLHHRIVTLHHRNLHASKKAGLCFVTQPRRCPVSYILTCPPSRALSLSAERSN